MPTRKDKTSGWSAGARGPRLVNLNRLPPPSGREVVNGLLETRRLAEAAGDPAIVAAVDADLARYGVVADD